MGNDMYNDEQLAHLRSEARRRENQSPSGVLARESFLRHLHSLADATVSADSLHPSEVALAEHDAALRSRSLPPEVEAAAEALREARERYRKPGGHYLTDDLRAERRRLGKLTDDLLAALSSARSAAPARDEVGEAAEALRELIDYAIQLEVLVYPEDEATFDSPQMKRAKAAFAALAAREGE